MTQPGMRRVTVPITPPLATTMQVSKFAPATLGREEASRAATLLQQLLFSFLDLYLASKQAHWNVVGPTFMPVHKDILDPLAGMAAEMADANAERIATLGGAPVGSAGAVAASQVLPDYRLLKADAQTHLRAIDGMVSGVVAQLRAAIAALGDLDVVSQNMVLGQAENLEHMQWFIRAHLENSNGELL